MMGGVLTGLVGRFPSRLGREADAYTANYRVEFLIADLESANPQVLWASRGSRLGFEVVDAEPSAVSVFYGRTVQRADGTIFVNRWQIERCECGSMVLWHHPLFIPFDRDTGRRSEGHEPGCARVACDSDPVRIRELFDLITKSLHIPHQE